MSGPISVVIDPGHDIARPGTSHHGVDERLVAWDIASYLDAYMRCGPLAATMLTRNRDERDKPYPARAEQAARWGAQLAVCLHINAAAGPGRGLIVFYPIGDMRSQRVAKVIGRCAPHRLWRDPHSGRQNCILATRDDWTRDAAYVMRPYAAAGMITVLVELGFATDIDDATALLSDSIRPQLAAMVTAGIAEAAEMLR